VIGTAFHVSSRRSIIRRTKMIKIINRFDVASLDSGVLSPSRLGRPEASLGSLPSHRYAHAESSR
jgi:hypothetical protein